MTTQTVPMLEELEEEVEGLGDQDGSSWGDYPLDTVLIRHEAQTVFEVVRRIGQKKFVMDPDFQREFVWPVEKQSKLIESVLMRIPLPVFYLAEDEQGRRVVVDGLQRLTTFDRFLNNKFGLKLKDQPKLDGKLFGELAPNLQTRVEDCNLVLYVIDSKVPERARLDIFERVNSGELLTRQQMRNSLYSGAATKFLKTEASTGLFAEATGQSLKSKTMRDREFVNRFCAFQLLSIEDYKGDMDDFLAKALRKMNSMSAAELETLSREFRTGLENNLSLFGKHAFRKHELDSTDRAVLNASLWDVMVTGLSRVDQKKCSRRQDKLKIAFYALLKDERFDKSITRGPNATSEVKHRFTASRARFAEVFGANPT